MTTRNRHGNPSRLRLLLLCLCLAGLLACVRNPSARHLGAAAPGAPERAARVADPTPDRTPDRTFDPADATADAPTATELDADPAVLAATEPDAVPAEVLAAGEETLPEPPREPEHLPVCDLFFPLSASEGLETTARLDLRSQGLSSWAALEGPVQRSLEYALNMPRGESALARPGMALTWGQVVRSLEAFLDLLPHLDRHPELLARRFVWYGMRQRPLMTGYYTAEIAASLTRRPGYDFPIYGVPPDLRYGRVRGRERTYRVENGRVRPYYERRDVDVRGVLRHQGLEIAWAKDPVDVFYMQVEGCGRLRLPDGSTRNVLYGAKNGYGFRSLGRILHARGLLPAGHLSKTHVREYFSRHPERMFDLMAENRSYVFFRLEDAPPEGAIGKPLTPMVSLATDRKLLPLGSLLAFEAEIPRAENGRPAGTRRVTGIGLPQDTGTAIRGPRLDYYVGEGNEVEPVASNIMTEATVYLLISKEALING